MPIIRCPHCQTRILTSDGIGCPACRRELASGEILPEYRQAGRVRSGRSRPSGWSTFRGWLTLASLVGLAATAGTSPPCFLSSEREGIVGLYLAALLLGLSELSFVAQVLAGRMRVGRVAGALALAAGVVGLFIGLAVFNATDLLADIAHDSSNALRHGRRPMWMDGPTPFASQYLVWADTAIRWPLRLPFPLGAAACYLALCYASGNAARFVKRFGRPTCRDEVATDSPPPKRQRTRVESPG